MSERPFTPDMLAERWLCSSAHIRRLCQRGDLPHFRVGMILSNARRNASKPARRRIREAKKIAKEKTE